MQKSIKSPSEEAIHLGAYEENCKKSCILQDIIQYFDTNRDAVYYFQDPISGHIYFDTCTNREECWLAEQLECDVLDLCSKKNRSKRSKPVDPYHLSQDHASQIQNQDNQMPMILHHPEVALMGIKFLHHVFIKPQNPVRYFILIIRNVLKSWKRKQGNKTRRNSPFIEEKGFQ